MAGVSVESVVDPKETLEPSKIQSVVQDLYETLTMRVP